jgi:hypothetical protein
MSTQDGSKSAMGRRSDWDVGPNEPATESEQPQDGSKSAMGGRSDWDVGLWAPSTEPVHENKIDQLKQTVKEPTDTVAELTQARDEAEDKVRELEQTVKELNDTVAKLTRARDEAEDRVRELETDAGQLVVDRDQAQNALVLAQQRLADRDDDIRALRRDLQHARTESADARAAERDIIGHLTALASQLAGGHPQAAPPTRPQHLAARRTSHGYTEAEQYLLFDGRTRQDEPTETDDRDHPDAEMLRLFRRIFGAVDKEAAPEEPPRQVTVAPGPDNKVDVRGDRGDQAAADQVTIGNSFAVVIGDNCRLTTIYSASVKRPTVDLDDLTDAARSAEGFRFEWFDISLFDPDNPTANTTVSGPASAPVDRAAGIRIKGGQGVAIGDDNRVKVNVHCEIKFFEPDVNELAANAEVRRSVQAYDENPDQPGAEDQVKRALQRVINQIELADLHQLPRPTMRLRPGSINVESGATIVGENPTVETTCSSPEFSKVRLR